jgi:hypothetical protein
MAGERDPSNDYYVVIKRHGGHGKTLWAYEIKRRSNPLGVKLEEGKFSTPQAAKQAGEATLRDLLNELPEQSGED